MPDLVLPELVPCPPMRSRMTERACVRMWTSTKEKPPAPHEARAACITCPLGAQRSGIDVAKAEADARAAALAETMSHLCPRCQRVAARLIRGRHCISCYNRDREARIGRNAKGTRPRLADLIHPEAVVVGSRVVVVEHVVSRTEALVVAARQAGPGVLIGVPPLSLATEDAAA